METPSLNSILWATLYLLSSLKFSWRTRVPGWHWGLKKTSKSRANSTPWLLIKTQISDCFLVITGRHIPRSIALFQNRESQHFLLAWNVKWSCFSFRKGNLLSSWDFPIIGIRCLTTFCSHQTKFHTRDDHCWNSWFSLIPCIVIWTALD